MIEYKDGKEYWNGRECDGNFIFRTLADMFPADYERYQKESMEFIKTNNVLCCPNCNYKLAINKTNSLMNAEDNIHCPSCKTLLNSAYK